MQKYLQITIQLNCTRVQPPLSRITIIITTAIHHTDTVITTSATSALCVQCHTDRKQHILLHQVTGLGYIVVGRNDLRKKVSACDGWDSFYVSVCTALPIHAMFVYAHEATLIFCKSTCKTAFLKTFLRTAVV